VASTVGHA
jgi:hypothetical protein